MKKQNAVTALRDLVWDFSLNDKKDPKDCGCFSRKPLRGFFLFFLISFVLLPVESAEIIRVKGKQVLIEDLEENLKLNETYDFLDSQQKVQGQVKILKKDNKRKRVIGRVLSGTPERMFRVESRENFDFSEDSGDLTAVQKAMSVRALGGLVTGTGFESLPFFLGGDFSMYVLGQFKILVGGDYWFAHETYSNNELIEGGAGAYYSFPLSPTLFLEGGLRLGYAHYRITRNHSGQIRTDLNNAVTLTPGGALLYQMNSNWTVLIELRKPIFLAWEKETSLEGLYALGGLDYQW